MSKKRPDLYHLAIQAIDLQTRLCDPRNPAKASLCDRARARAARRWAAWEAEKARRVEQYVWLPWQQFDIVLGLSRHKRGNL